MAKMLCIQIRILLIFPMKINNSAKNLKKESSFYVNLNILTIKLFIKQRTTNNAKLCF